MNQLNFSLIPFDLASAPNIAIAGSILRDQQKLKIEYILTGELDKVIIPVLKTKGDRRFDLWEHTCFEFFLGIKDTSEYWEFNLSPTRDWNVFHFFRYRHNIVEEIKFSSLPFQVIQEKNCLRLALKVNLAKIINPNTNLKIGITTVIEEQHQFSFWALKHPQTEADFHDQASFTIASRSKI